MSKRLSMEEVADLLRESGFEVVGDDVAFLSTYGVVLDFKGPEEPQEATPIRNEIAHNVAKRDRMQPGFARAVCEALQHVAAEEDERRRSPGRLRNLSQRARHARVVH